MKIDSLLLALTTAGVITFPGGTAVVTPSHGMQHVVIKDARGTVTSDSYCDSSTGTYQEIVAFGSAMKAAVRHRDNAALARLMQYPLRVNTARAGMVTTRTIKSSRDFLAAYSGIFTAPIAAQISGMQPHEVFCRNGMAMFAGGTLWAEKNASGAIKAGVVNL